MSPPGTGFTTHGKRLRGTPPPRGVFGYKPFRFNDLSLSVLRKNVILQGLRANSSFQKSYGILWL